MNIEVYNKILDFADETGLEISDDTEFFTVISSESPEEILDLAKEYFQNEPKIVTLFKKVTVSSKDFKIYKNIPVVSEYEQYSED